MKKWDDFKPDTKDQIKDIYEKYIKEAGNIKDISRWSIKKSISKKLLEGTRKNETDVLDAIPDLSQIREGDKIFIYRAVDGERQQIEEEKIQVGLNEKGKPIYEKTGKKIPLFYKKTGLPKMEPNDFLKQTKFYTNDAYTAHYYGRVYATLSIFEEVLDISTFLDYSNPKNLGKLP